MRVVGPDRYMQGLSLDGGKEHLVQKDGTFHLDEATGKRLVKSGDFAQVGMTLRKVKQSFFCPACGRENVIKDSCGCGWHELAS